MFQVKQVNRANCVLGCVSISKTCFYFQYGVKNDNIIGGSLFKLAPKPQYTKEGTL